MVNQKPEPIEEAKADPSPGADENQARLGGNEVPETGPPVRAGNADERAAAAKKQKRRPQAAREL